MRQKVLFLVLSLLAALGYFGAKPAVAENWIWSASPARNIVAVYPNESGYIFYLDGAIINASSPCHTTGANRFIVDKNLSNYHGIMSTALTGFANNNVAWVVYDADSTACEVPVNSVYLN